MPQTNDPIAVMDADCALCSWGARLIHRLDKSGQIKIAPIQSKAGAALMREHGIDPADPDTWLFIEGGTVWRDFDALIRVGQRSGGLGHLIAILRMLPPPLRRWLYLRIASNCYALFGRGDMCAVPDPGFRARLLS